MVIQLETEKDALGRQIRKTRRNLGLTQGALADILGISQTRVSLWEKGREELPRRHRLKLLDILNNKSGQLDPLIERLVRLDPSIMVATEAGQKILMMGETVRNAYQFNRSDVEGKDHAAVFDAEWKSKANFDLSSYYYSEYQRDIEHSGRPKGRPGFRCSSTIVQMQFEGRGKFAIIKTEFLGPSQGEWDIKVNEFVTAVDIET